MKKVFWLALVLALISPLLASAKEYKLDQKASVVGFSIGHLAGVAEGRFRDFDGKLTFDPKNPTSSSVEVEIKVASIDTGIAKRDRHLLKDDFFDEAKHSKITFKSVDWKDRGQNRYTVTGDLTIRGVSKRISFPVTLKRKNRDWLSATERLVFRADFELDRHQFGVSGGSGTVNAEVDIRLNVQAVAPD